MKTWHLSHGRNGFTLEVVERSDWGSVAAWLIESSDLEWWGKYHNLPFCWINPWGWTWRIGREEHTLGDTWCGVGHWVLNLAWKLQRERSIISFTLTSEQVKELFPETWTWFDDALGLDDEGDDEGGEDAEPGLSETGFVTD